MRAGVAFLVFAALVVPACEAERIPRHFTNEGRLCVYPAGAHYDPRMANEPSYAYPADAACMVAVAFTFAFGSSCSDDVVASCSVAEVNGDLEVTSEGSYVEIVRSSCTADRVPFVAHCSTPVLAAGDHVLHHGADSLVLSLPSAGPPPCTGQLQKN